MVTIIQIRIIELINWKARHGMLILRISLGVVFIWFGALKYFHGVSPAEMLAGRTIDKLTFGFIHPGISMPLLATWECLIGIGLIYGKFMRLTLFLLYMQMAGTFLPLVFFRSETWTTVLFVPTLLGQYIIKNCVLISAGIVIGATSNGGALISNPIAARKAQKLQLLYQRYHRRYHKEPTEK